VSPLQTPALNQLTQAHDFDAIMTNPPHTADPSGVLVNAFINGLQIAGPQGAPQIQALVDKANIPTQTQDQRAQYFHQADQLIADNSWTVPICNAPTPWLTTSKVQNVDNQSWIQTFEVRYLSMAA